MGSLHGGLTLCMEEANSSTNCCSDIYFNKTLRKQPIENCAGLIASYSSEESEISQLE